MKNELIMKLYTKIFSRIVNLPKEVVSAFKIISQTISDISKKLLSFVNSFQHKITDIVEINIMNSDNLSSGNARFSYDDTGMFRGASTHNPSTSLRFPKKNG